MQPFKMAGKWWLPESPDKPVFGTLSCSESGELELSLLGILAGGWPFDREKEIPVILGAMDDDKFGQDVTLLDCFVTELSGAPFGGKETIFAHRAYVGAHPSAVADLLFSRADVELSGLPNWASNFTGFTKSSSAPFSVVWQQPETNGGEFPGGEIALGAGCTSSGNRERRLSERLGLVLSFDPPVQARQIEARYVYPLQNLLTFATDHANSVSELSFTPAGTHKPARVVGATTFWDDSVAANLREWSMLFTFEDIKERFTELCRKWLVLSERQQPAFAVYFGSIYRPPGYTDLRLSLLAQALSLYHIARPPSPPAIVPTEGGVPSEIHKLLGTHPVVTVRNALVAFADEFGSHLSPMIGGTAGSVNEFIEYATNTVRYTLTRTPPAGPYAGDGSDLYWLCERVAFVFKIAVLTDLDFTPEQIGRLLERNRTYRHLRDSARSKKRV